MNREKERARCRNERESHTEQNGCFGYAHNAVAHTVDKIIHGVKGRKKLEWLGQDTHGMKHAAEKNTGQNHVSIPGAEHIKIFGPKRSGHAETREYCRDRDNKINHQKRMLDDYWFKEKRNRKYAANNNTAPRDTAGQKAHNHFKIR